MDSELSNLHNKHGACNACSIYGIYEKFSSVYIIDLDQLKQFLNNQTTQSMIEIEQWMQEHCYYLITCRLVNNFDDKIIHNLNLARQRNDMCYVQYISQKFGLIINNWTYVPDKIPIKLRIKMKINSKQPSRSNNGDKFKVSDLLASLLTIPDQQLFTRKSDIIRLVHQYIYHHHLQDSFDRKIIHPNQSLQNLLRPLEPKDKHYTYFNLEYYLEHQITKQ